MHFLLLPLLAIPSVLGDCTRFTTSDRWGTKLNTWPGYRFLANEPIRQVSNFTTCPEEFDESGPAEPECGKTGNVANCKVRPEGGISVSARFSVTPTNNSMEALEAFFKVVSKAVDANGGGDKPYGEGIPRYQICGSLQVEFEKLGVPAPGYCITPGDSSWAQYEPEFICVNGTAEDCTNGPFESGTELVVCGVGRWTNGYIRSESNRTISRNGQTYEVRDQNPAVNSGLTCEASLGAVGFEVEPWSFGVMGLAIVVGLLV